MANKKNKDSEIKRVSIRFEKEFHTLLKHLSVKKQTTIQDLVITSLEKEHYSEMLEMKMTGELLES